VKSTNPEASVSAVQLDVTDDKSIENAVASVTKEFGRLDVLINNAGIISHATKLIDSLRETFETNTFGAANVTDHFAPLLVKSKDARIIYVTSGLGSITYKLDPNSNYYKVPGPSYRMSKAALNMLMACNKFEYGPKGVKVWTFCPGYVVTNLSRTGEEGRKQRVANGAGSPTVSGKNLSNIVFGKRDADEGKFVYEETGIHPW
jgi:NAD(P)-dependent dehydrogenase (short-subunit alcohol dehydrogenase family)